ncbi:MAG: hypothetical protein SGI92_19875 [Bryobacteraceae bacterium]|nr:hypothetical protein [Bryobacteraceae bacterium]
MAAICAPKRGTPFPFRVIIQPVLIPVGQVQTEIATLLKDLEYTMRKSGVASHPLAAEWIRQQATTELRTRNVVVTDAPPSH